MLRVGVLASGAGSNFQALAEALRDHPGIAELALLIVNVPGAGALDRARALGLPSLVIDHRAFADRAGFEAEVVRALTAARVELVCLAGFMRLVGETLLAPFEGRMLNIHPALLPAFPGLHAVRQALAAGVAISGCTVHLVDRGTDTGPIVLQAAVPVNLGDDEAALAARIHAQEHRIYPQAVRLMAENRIQLEDRKVRIDAPAAKGALVGPVEPTAESLAASQPAP